ncbi:MAG: Transcription elongation factor GreA [Candidatus Moranbacteria bacterium GW2011_GWD2_36_198]|nr:MAG: Transcription elongation factor GreA [Candidatus Moranbacteria bacterium GW2011_GWD2_36_198]
MVRFITKEGLKKLNEELDERKGKLRQEIAQAIKEAKEQGDLPKQNHNKMKMNHALENLKWLSKILKLLKEMILKRERK